MKIDAISIVLPKDKAQVAAVKPQVEHSSKLVGEIQGTQKYELENGSTLLVSQNDLNDIIAISINVKGGNF